MKGAQTPGGTASSPCPAFSRGEDRACQQPRRKPADIHDALNSLGRRQVSAHHIRAVRSLLYRADPYKGNSRSCMLATMENGAGSERRSSSLMASRALSIISIPLITALPTILPANLITASIRSPRCSSARTTAKPRARMGASAIPGGSDEASRWRNNH